MISNFKFLSGQFQRLIQTEEEPLRNGEWGVLYRNRNNNIFLSNVKIDGYEYSNDNWVEYDTGFISMDYFFGVMNPPNQITPVVRSIECNGIIYDIRYSNIRRIKR